MQLFLQNNNYMTIDIHRIELKCSLTSCHTYNLSMKTDQIIQCE
jgi:hypothetical protein